MGQYSSDKIERSRGRRGFLKSKGGCHTCKKRRVKCDETKPGCDRCRLAGWICDGYPELPSEKTQSQHIRPVPKTHLLLPKTSQDTERSSMRAMTITVDSYDSSIVSWKEKKLFNYFLSDVCPLMRGNWCSLFCDFVPRVSFSEKAIQHGVIAGATLHRLHTQGVDTDKIGDNKFVLLQYNKAISLLRSKNSTDINTTQITLLACIVFSFVEMMRGNQEMVESHLRSGLKVLASYTRLYKLPSIIQLPLDSRHPNYEQSLLHNLISSCFMQCLQTVMSSPLGSNTYDPTSIPMSRIPDTLSFATVFEAKDSLNELLSQFMRVPEAPDGSRYAELHKAKGKTTLFARIDGWTARLTLFLDENFNTLCPSDMRNLRLLRIQSIIMRIWGAITSSGTQKTFDHHLEDFSMMLSLSSQIIDAQEEFDPLDAAHTVHQQQEHYFSPSLCPIFALKFVACKCRSPIMRRQALTLLTRLRPQIQGAWDARVAEKISRFIVDFEEKQCQCPVTEDPLTWPTESQRIHTACFLPFPDGMAGVGGPKVMFVWQPGGRGTKFRNWLERIRL